MFVAVIMENFELTEEEILVKQEKQWLLKQVELNRITESETLEVEEKPAPDDTSLGMLGPDNYLRKFFQAFTQHPIFEGIVIMVIVASSISIAVEGPPHARYLRDRPDTRFGLRVTNEIVFWFFWFECLSKIVAMGFYGTPDAYIKQGWCRLDFFVVISCTVDYIMELSGLGSHQWVRVLRVVRPLRLIKQNEGLRIVVMTLYNCIPTVAAVLAVSALFWLTFALLGMGLFMGKFYSCHADRAGMVELSKIECLQQGGTWENPPYSFDDLLASMRTLFICSTLEGWVDIMHSGMDTTEVDMAPILNNSYSHFVFFVIFTVLGSFFVTNLFIGVLVNVFRESSGSALLTEAQQHWKLGVMLARRTTRPQKEPLAGTSGVRATIFKIVQAQAFDIVIGVLIVLNVIVIVSEHFPQSAELTSASVWCNFVFLVLFTCEIILQLLALGPVVYFKDTFARIDAVVIGVSWVGMVMETTVAIQAFRSLRILRVMLLLKASDTLQQLTYTLVLSIIPSINLCILLSLVIFMYGIVGMQVFGQLPFDEFVNKNDNFDHIFSSCKFLFQIATGQDFMRLVYELEATVPDASIHPFIFICSFYIILQWVCMNVFVAVLLECFEDNFVIDTMELSQDDIDEFAEHFLGLAGGENAKEGIGYGKMEELTIMLAEAHNPLGNIVDRELYWQNRVMFELDLHLEATPGETNAKRFDKSFRIHFHDLLLVLVLLSQVGEGVVLSFTADSLQPFIY
jgi:hypothetical protein